MIVVIRTVLAVVLLVTGIVAIVDLFAIAVNLVSGVNLFASLATTLKWFGGYSIFFALSLLGLIIMPDDE